MSNALVIAAVTAVLRARILDVAGGDWSAETARTQVVSLPPDHVVVTDESGPMINVFLLGARPDSTAAQVVRTTRTPGAQPPAIALTLSYLVSAQGVLPLDADILFGQVLEAVMQTPVVTPDMMRAALDPNGHDRSGLLSKAFRSEAMRVLAPLPSLRLTLRPMSVEETSSLWRGLGTPQRPGFVLEAAGVLL